MNNVTVVSVVELPQQVIKFIYNKLLFTRLLSSTQYFCVFEDSFGFVKVNRSVYKESRAYRFC